MKDINISNPIRNLNTLWKRFNDEIVTLNTETRQYHVLNATAAIVFEMSSGEQQLEDIAEVIADAYAIDPNQALADVRETISGMEKIGLIIAS
jgi:hypothetical protein